MAKNNKSVANRTKMVKVLLKIIGIILLLIVVFLVWFDQSRSFYCLSEGKCVTVWKRLGNKCYIIPGKYYGIFKPSDNYIQTTNIGSVAIIWTNDRKFLIDIDKSTEFLNLSSGDELIELYNDNITVNDSLYTYFDGRYHKYKDKVDYLIINIKENYATDKTGKKIK